MNLLKNISWRAYYVWRRNLDVSLVTWLTNVVPPITEPMLYIFAFGFGLGSYVTKIQYGNLQLQYLEYLGPGMVAVGVMFYSLYENMYGSFIRMYYEKTFDAIISTPLSLEDVLAGELMWGATKGLFAGCMMLGVISIFGLASYPSALVIIPLSLLGGLMFAGFGLLFAAISPTIDSLNLPTFLFANPMFLFSGTFFPLNGFPKWVLGLAYALPLTHIVDIARAAAVNVLAPRLLYSLLYILVLTCIICYYAMYMMRKRLIK